MIRPSTLTDKSFINETRSTQELFSTTETNPFSALRKQTIIIQRQAPKNLLKTDMSKILTSSKAKEETGSPSKNLTDHIGSDNNFADLGYPGKVWPIRPFNIFGGDQNQQRADLKQTHGWCRGNLQC